MDTRRKEKGVRGSLSIVPEQSICSHQAGVLIAVCSQREFLDHSALNRMLGTIERHRLIRASGVRHTAVRVG